MTMILRPVQHTDLEAVHQLAVGSGVGITSFSKDINVIQQRIALSVESFEKIVTTPYREDYLFVLEDSLTHEVMGTSAIKASIGYSAPLYTYRLINRTRIAHDIGVRSDQTWLMLVNDFHQKSELCTLYLRSDYRHSHHGAFLSRARFLYMANQPTRFEASIIAELRGVTDAKGRSPFWDNLGQHFFQIPFDEADALTASTNKQFIADLIPDYPIPVQLLNKKAQDVIGLPHPNTKPAMHILLNEGFRYANCVDIFDAGPVIEATCADISTVKMSATATIVEIVDAVDSPQYMISTHSNPFRASMGSLIIHEKGVVITKALADGLQVHQGVPVRFAIL